MDDLIIGIDLGTTNSCVSFFYNNKVKIIENYEGDAVTPSFIFYRDMNTTEVGKNARNMASHKPEFGVYGIKRLIGRKCDDPSLAKNIEHFQFKIESDESNDPVVVVSEKIRKTPQELCTVILKKLKTDAELKLNCSLSKVVITVPAYFNVTQREITLAAARDAGFMVLKLLNEPTAAVLSFYHEYDFGEQNYFLVYDLGGGTFDVAILRRINNDIKIVEVAGDMWLGGQDFDDIIVDYVCDEVRQKYGCNLQKSDLRRIYNKCEEAKRALTTLEETAITLVGIIDNHPTVSIPLTREHFDTMCDRLFQKTIRIIDVCLKSSKVDKHDISKVILAGGSTRIPRIEKMICDYFGRNILSKLVNRDECVAEGAAIQAAMLSTNVKQRIDAIQLIDVVPLSLGVADFVDKMDFIIKRKTSIPASGVVTYSTSEANQHSIYLRIFEGERLNAKKNRFLGDLTVSGITPAPPGKCKVTVTMNVDHNSILTVTAKETLGNNTKELKINYVRGNKSEKEIEDFLMDAEKNRNEDESFERFAIYKAYLLEYCAAVIYNLENKKIADKYEAIYNLCAIAKEQTKEADISREDEIRELIAKIELCCEPVVKSKKFKLMPPCSFSS